MPSSTARIETLVLASRRNTGRPTELGRDCRCATHLRAHCYRSSLTVDEASQAANHAAYGEFLAMWRFQSGAPSVHQAGPRSPRAIFASSTFCLACSRASASAAFIAAPLDRRAAIRAFVQCCRSSPVSDGLLRRQRRPRTTKYRPSGVSGYAFPAGRRASAHTLIPLLQANPWVRPDFNPGDKGCREAPRQNLR